MRERVAERLEALAADPRSGDVKPLKCGLRGSYRVRLGNYRVGYEVDEEVRVVRVWQVGPRQRFYEKTQRRRLR